MPIAVPKNARQFVEMAKGLADAIDAIDSINGLEQLEAESRGRVEALRAQCDEIQAQVAAGNDAVSAAQKLALEITDQAKVDAETIKARADDEAKQMLAAAHEAVEAAKAKERRAEADQRKAEAAVAAAKTQLAELTARMEEAQAVIAKAEAVNRLLKG